MKAVNHTKYNYDECFAKLVIEKFLYKRYGTLILSDKPDLRTMDNLTGIEVVNAVPEKTHEVISLASKVVNGNDPDKANKKRIDRIEKEGCKLTDYGLIHPAITYSYDSIHPVTITNSPLKEVLFRFEEKVQKLNGGGYAPLERNDLFVYAEVFIDDVFIQPLLKDFLDKNTDPIKFGFVYVFSLNGIHEFDLLNETHSVIDTDKNKMICGIPDAALILANNGEENQ